MQHALKPDLRQRPTLWVLAGHSPSGAGLQADIETAAAFGCHACTLPTCMTVQNTRGVREVQPVDPGFLLRQAYCLLEDLPPPCAIKTGLLPDEPVLEAVLNLLELLPAQTPLVVDPVLGSGSGAPLTSSTLPCALRERLLPRALIATPNRQEYRRLQLSSNDAASPEWLLITGADEPTTDVSHELLHRGTLHSSYRWPRWQGSFHGSGCTLATAIAACLAGGAQVPVAVARALDWTWHTLGRGTDLRGGQYLPGRIGI